MTLRLIPDAQCGRSHERLRCGAIYLVWEDELLQTIGTRSHLAFASHRTYDGPYTTAASGQVKLIRLVVQENDGADERT